VRAATIGSVAPAILRVIEPNLVGASGHYGEYVRALAERAEGRFSRIEVLCDAGARLGSLADCAPLEFRPCFPGRGRRAAEWRALREAVAAHDPFLVLTARTPDVVMLEAASRLAGRDLGHARLYFHWRERSTAQRVAATACTKVRREALAIAPTPTTAEFLRSTGWRRVLEIPYPAIAPEAPFPAGPLERLLVAGAARMNKGIDAVAALAARLAQRGDTVELLVQTTGKRRSGASGTKEAKALADLAASGCPGLRLDPSAPDRPAYVARFRGSLVLTPYCPDTFADNVSGIALDALLHGAPVVATAGTWQARVVERYGAGTVMRRWDAESLDEAVADARVRWDEVSAAARRAAQELASAHDPAHLVRALACGR
jgi:hypothetical protein